MTDASVAAHPLSRWLPPPAFPTLDLPHLGFRRRRRPRLRCLREASPARPSQGNRGSFPRAFPRSRPLRCFPPSLPRRLHLGADGFRQPEDGMLAPERPDPRSRTCQCARSPFAALALSPPPPAKAEFISAFLAGSELLPPSLRRHPQLSGKRRSSRAPAGRNPPPRPRVPPSARRRWARGRGWTCPPA